MAPQPPLDRKTRVVLVLVVAAIALAMMGNFLWPILKDLYHARQNGGNASNAPLIMFGVLFLVMILAVVFSVARGLRKLSNPGSTNQPPRDPKPWLARADWAAGKIKSSTMGQPKMYLIMGVGFCGIGGLSTYFALPEVWQKQNYAALLALLFPLVGIGLLIAFLNAWRSQKRFGDCFFEPAQIPVPLGGVLEGMIQTGKPLKLEHELNLKFSCIRHVVTGSGKSRSVREYALWQNEKIYSERANLSDPEAGRTGIPIHFKLPTDQPECYSRSGESVFWRLESKSKMRGPDFHAIFDLPVFKVAGAVIEKTDEADANDSDPTAALQAPMEEIRRDEKSKIKVTDGPDGHEFYFPAARNVGAAIFVTLVTFLFIGIAACTYHLHAPILFPIVFGIIGALMILGVLSAWFKSSRVTIDSTTVRATNRWLVFSRTRQFSADDIARFATKTGMQSGSQVFTDIKLIPRGSDEKFAAAKEKFQETFQETFQAAALPEAEKVAERFRQAAGPSGVTVASGIASVAEANWLVAEMNKALGRKL